ncbi:type I secretion protein, partial [Salmonella enterica]|nr:type I secretion protein [Salmonella enterica]
MNNNFFDVIRKYCLVEEVAFVYKNKSKDMYDIVQNFNDYVNDSFFDFELTSNSCCEYAHLPKTFIVEWTESYFLILQKEKNKIINLSSSEVVMQDDLRSKRIF